MGRCTVLSAVLLLGALLGAFTVHCNVVAAEFSGRDTVIVTTSHLTVRKMCLIIELVWMLPVIKMAILTGWSTGPAVGAKKKMMHNRFYEHRDMSVNLSVVFGTSVPLFGATFWVPPYREIICPPNDRRKSSPGAITRMPVSG